MVPYTYTILNHPKKQCILTLHMFPQRNVAFYMRAAASFLRGTEDKKPVKAPWGWHSRGQRRLEVD